MILGLDIGGTNIRAGLVDSHYELYGFEMSSSTALFRPGADSLKELTGFIRSYCNRNMDGRLPRAVSIGFPSTLDKSKRRLLSTPNLPGLDNLPVADVLEEALRIPVYINRDVNLLMLNDLHSYRIPHEGIAIGLYIGTGLGNAICINGEFPTGKNGVIGELGHVPLIGSKRLCSCGNVGCLETMASGRYLAELQKTCFPGESIKTLFVRHGESRELHRFVEILSIAVAIEVNILDPDNVILGGGVLQMEGFPMDELRRLIIHHTRKPYPSEGLTLLVSQQKQESGIVGAGIYAYESIAKGGILHDRACV